LGTTEVYLEIFVRGDETPQKNEQAQHAATKASEARENTVAEQIICMAAVTVAATV